MKDIHKKYLIKLSILSLIISIINIVIGFIIGSIINIEIMDIVFMEGILLIILGIISLIDEEVFGGININSIEYYYPQYIFKINYKSNYIKRTYVNLIYPLSFIFGGIICIIGYILI